MAHLLCPLPTIPGAEEAPAIPDMSFSPENTTAAAVGVDGGKAEYKPPESILIIGAGVFGLSTALTLTQHPSIPPHTPITVIDRSPTPGVFPAPDAASVDASRIIRADYADAAYSKLAGEAQARWRLNAHDPASLGGGGRYAESGLLLAADDPDGDGATARPDGHPTGLGYAKRSWVNALALAHLEGRPLASVRLLPMPYAVARASCTGAEAGEGEWADWGYLNTAAGWADAEGSMRWLYERVVETGRVVFVNGTVEALETTTTGDGQQQQQQQQQKQRVTGARLTTGAVLTADLTIVAAGAWTPSLIDLADQAVATGQCLAYIQLTNEEQARLADMPVCLNLTDGCFAIPPRNNILKIARHAYGYLNPQPPSHPPLAASQSASAPSPPNPVSQPRTHLTDPSLPLPSEGAADLRRALRRMFGPALAERPFLKTRLCWYTDTATGDWLIDYHPAYANLFVATGGSGHAFKFLPILGDKVVDCLLGRCPREFREKWKWKGRAAVGANATAVAAGGEKGARGGSGSTLGNEGTSVIDGLSIELCIATEDGSRGGKPGLILQDEMAKSRRS
ncbi:DAO-domain-containing protein [Nemania diffusa]|nr:DAO-domain-containing protein [Nemania diffusa]